MVFTAMTSNPDAARPDFETEAFTRVEEGLENEGDIISVSSPDAGIVVAWWDALGVEMVDGQPTDNTNCATKAARLGFDR